MRLPWGGQGGEQQQQQPPPQGVAPGQQGAPMQAGPQVSPRPQVQPQQISPRPQGPPQQISPRPGGPPQQQISPQPPQQMQQQQMQPQQMQPQQMQQQQMQPQQMQPQQMAPMQQDPNAVTMEAKVSSRGATPDGVAGVRRIKGRWSLEQLRQTDGIIPLQYGTNKFDSQKLMTGFGTPRNTTTRIKAECLQEIPEDIARMADLEVRPQAGSNRYASQRGMTGMGTGRDVCREGVRVNILPEDCQPVGEEKERASEGVVRLQSGTNRFDSQKGMTGFGTSRREVTKMKDTKHPEYDLETSLDQASIPLQSGTNKFASQKGMTGFGTSRRETTKMLDSAHPEISIEHPDASTIPSQMGSNKYASQKGMTGFGQPRWEALQDVMLGYQNQKSQAIIPSQMGSNQFASQANHAAGPGFGAPRDICHTIHTIEAGELPYEDIRKSELIIPSQSGWNRGDSQRGMTGFGAPRDVKGKHLKRIWELEYPEEAMMSELALAM